MFNWIRGWFLKVKLEATFVTYEWSAHRRHLERGPCALPLA